MSEPAVSAAERALRDLMYSGIRVRHAIEDCDRTHEVLRDLMESCRDERVLGILHAARFDVIQLASRLGDALALALDSTEK